jgi:hypothetical protein
LPDPGFVRGDCIGEEAIDDDEEESGPRGKTCAGIRGDGPIWCGRTWGERVAGSWVVSRTGGTPAAFVAGDAVPLSCNRHSDEQYSLYISLNTKRSRMGLTLCMAAGR